MNLKTSFGKLFFFLVFFRIFSTQAEVVERIVAIVNSEVVLESDFQNLKNSIHKPGLVDETLINKPLADLKSNRKLQLDYLIHEKLIEAEIKRLNLSVTTDRVDQEIKELAKKNSISQEEMLLAIKSQGVTIAEYRDFLKNKIEKQSLIDSEIISKLKVSDEEALNEYIKKNPNAKSSVDEYSISHIFFNPKKGGAKGASERAEKVLSDLKQGKSFESLAESYSEDSNFSASGFFGTFKSGEFLKEFEEAVINLKPNETSQVIKSKKGFHILKLLSKKVISDSNFEKQKNNIKSELLEVKFKQQFNLWLQIKKEEAFIKINDPV
ncbi:MAG: peptidylprolyl isomerase [Pseudobdellovibrionaceae bacterium]